VLVCLLRVLQEAHPLFASSSTSDVDYVLDQDGNDISVTLLQTLCNGFDSLAPTVGDFKDIGVNGERLVCLVLAGPPI
jgi:hypothetical protein